MPNGLLLYRLLDGVWYSNSLPSTAQKMVRSILPHLHHWTGLRLILGFPALLHDFDPLTQYFWQKYLTDQEILRRRFRTTLELGACSIWAQSDHGKTWHGQEMCHKKCQNFDDFRKFDVFSRILPDEPGTISRPKKQHFDTKSSDFQIKKSWCEALSLTFITRPAFGWFWGSPR